MTGDESKKGERASELVEAEAEVAVEGYGEGESEQDEEQHRGDGQVGELGVLELRGSPVVI